MEVGPGKKSGSAPPHTGSEARRLVSLPHLDRSITALGIPAAQFRAAKGRTEVDRRARRRPTRVPKAPLSSGQGRTTAEVLVGARAHIILGSVPAEQRICVDISP